MFTLPAILCNNIALLLLIFHGNVNCFGVSVLVGISHVTAQNLYNSFCTKFTKVLAGVLFGLRSIRMISLYQRNDTLV